MTSASVKPRPARPRGGLERLTRRGARKPFEGRVATITGAGSGIGRALAVELARHGASLALSDIQEAGLAETVSQCAELGVPVRSDVIDVTDRSAMAKFADNVVAHFGRVNMIFNNAGVIFTGSIVESNYEDMEHVLDVDFWGVVNGTKAFLPHLVASGSGYIINISSAFGLMAAPSYSAYNAAKFAVRGFTEAVQQEVRRTGHPVHVSCVFPGGVRTPIFLNSTCANGENHRELVARFDAIARTSPEQAAASILRGVRANKSRILVGVDAHAIDLLVRLTGTGYQRVAQMRSRKVNPHQETGPD